MNTVSKNWSQNKSKEELQQKGPTVERCKHVKSQATTVYFRLGKLRRVSTYVQHVWGIIGHVTVEAGNTVGTPHAPPQVPPKLCGGRLIG